ncbi:aldehyde ferredoxin oxidoreductase family protein [Candidatus Omnitrophota bacterium]
MTEWYGWAGTILDVNLTTGEIKKLPLSKDMAVNYIGGSGFADKILYDEVGPDTDPLGPDNIIMITQGTLSGTVVPASGRYDVITKSPYTGIYLRTNGGGFFGPELKWAGYDLIIIRGRSEKPVYLWIEDDHVELRDANHIWGKDTWTTERMLRDEHDDPEIQTLKIGPAGENLCLSACVIGNLSRAAGKGGSGAVLGSKNLKAIAVRGTKGVNIAKPDQLEKICREFRERIKNDIIFIVAQNYGTPSRVSDPFTVSTLGEQFSDLWSTQFAKKHWDKSLACFNCPMHCSHYYTVKEGKYKGVSGEGLEANAIIYGGVLPQINNSAFVCNFNNICNQLGMHTDSPGMAMAWAIELYRDGIITKEDTDGIEVVPGNEEGYLELIYKMVKKEGFGAIMDAYPLRAVEMLGRGSDLYMAHVKGMHSRGAGIAQSSVWTLGLAVATRGRDHLVGAPLETSLSYDWRYLGGPDKQKAMEVLKQIGKERYDDPEIFLESRRWSVEPAKAKNIFDTENICTLGDMTGVCKFVTTRTLFQYGANFEDFANFLSAATGVDFSADDMVKATEREILLERAFNAREGIRRVDDYPYPFYYQLKYWKEHPRYDYKGFPITLGNYDKLLDEYYKVRGCDLETGIPTKAKLEEVGLRDVADDLEKRGILPG